MPAFSTIEFYGVPAGRRAVCGGSGTERGEYQVLQSLSCYYHHTGAAFRPIFPSIHTSKTTGWNLVLQLCPQTDYFRHKKSFLLHFQAYTSKFRAAVVVVVLVVVVVGGGGRLPKRGL